MTSVTSLLITNRPAHPDDAPALWRLAALDSATVPAEPLLLAEVDGQLRVAVSMSDRDAIADPFAGTAHIVEMLRHIAREADQPSPRRRFRSKQALAGLPNTA